MIIFIKNYVFVVFLFEYDVRSRTLDLVLDICKKSGATEYLSGVGGKSYLNLESFISANIDIKFIDNDLPKSYPQLFKKIDFLNDLSAIDIIFNCGERWKDKITFQN